MKDPFRALLAFFVGYFLAKTPIMRWVMHILYVVLIVVALCVGWGLHKYEASCPACVCSVVTVESKVQNTEQKIPTFEENLLKSTK